MPNLTDLLNEKYGVTGENIADALSKAAGTYTPNIADGILAVAEKQAAGTLNTTLHSPHVNLGMGFGLNALNNAGPQVVEPITEPETVEDPEEEDE